MDIGYLFCYVPVKTIHCKQIYFSISQGSAPTLYKRGGQV